MIYFLRHPETGLIKIGTTIHYRQRLSQLMSQYGDMELLGLMPGSYDDEKVLHEQFAHLRGDELPGQEWFKPAKDLTGYIERYSELTLPLPLYDMQDKRNIISDNDLRKLQRIYVTEDEFNFLHDEATRRGLVTIGDNPHQIVRRLLVMVIIPELKRLES